MSVESLKAEIRLLMRELAKNGMRLRMEKRTSTIIDLMAARMEIYKSIAHRQGLIIEAQQNQLNFGKKVA